MSESGHAKALSETKEVSGRRKRSLKWYLIFGFHMVAFAAAVFFLGGDVLRGVSGGGWDWTLVDDLYPLAWEPVGKEQTDLWMERIYSTTNRVHVSVIFLAAIGVVSIVNIWAVAMAAWWRRMGGWGRIFRRSR